MAKQTAHAKGRDDALAALNLLEGLKTHVPKGVSLTVEDKPYNPDVLSGHYDPLERQLYVGQRDAHTLAHELGHSQQSDLLMTARLLGRPLSPMIGGMGGLLAGLAKKPAWLIPTALGAAAAYAPVLYAEYDATRRGAKLLEALGATPEQMEAYYARTHGKALKSYAIEGALSQLPGLVWYGSGRAVDMLTTPR